MNEMPSAINASATIALGRRGSYDDTGSPHCAALSRRLRSSTWKRSGTITTAGANRRRAAVRASRSIAWSKARRSRSSERGPAIHQRQHTAHLRLVPRGMDEAHRHRPRQLDRVRPQQHPVFFEHLVDRIIRLTTTPARLRPRRYRHPSRSRYSPDRFGDRRRRSERSAAYRQARGLMRVRRARRSRPRGRIRRIGQ